MTAQLLAPGQPLTAPARARAAVRVRGQAEGATVADEASFAEFYRANYRGVVAQLYAYTGDLTEAQESAQEAFVRAWSRWDRIADYDEPRGWVCRVGYRVAISRWRRARTAVEVWRKHGPPPNEPAPDAANADLVVALRRLPEAQRRALVLHYLGGFSVAEIAALDGVATGTVKSRLSRGREALAGLLGEYHGGRSSTVDEAASGPVEVCGSA